MLVLAQALQMVIQQPFMMVLVLMGAVIGLVFGAIPGLTATTGVALALPLTFALNPEMGMALLIGIYVGGISGGFIAATLLGIPGTPASIATCFDAYPLSQQGQPVKALAIGATASFMGTLGSTICLVYIAPIIANIALKLSPFEYSTLMLCALTLIATLAREEPFRGLASGFLGILLGSIGIAPIGSTLRFTFGLVPLSAGLNLLAMILGVFAIKQISVDYAEDKPIPLVDLEVKGLGFRLGEIVDNAWNIVRSFLIGLWIGFLPGMGAGLANLIAYAQAKSSSKHPEKFGKGAPEGIWASEVSNNAAIGGAMIPMLTLGIPGDSVTALLLGGLMIHGLIPGPLLYIKQPRLVNSIFGLLAISAVICLVLCYLGMRLFPRVLTIPRHYLYPVLMVLSFVGSFASNNYSFDFWIMLLFALVGMLMDMAKMPMSPMILGFILGPMLEENLRRALTYSAGSWLPFITRPVSAVLLAIAVFSLVNSVIKMRRHQALQAGKSA